MNKTYSILFCLAFALLFCSNFKSVNNNTGKFIFTLLGEAPMLPATPYDYENINMPRHVKSTNPGTGYGTGEVIKTSFDFIDDDIATLGRVLFYDKKLSALENISCGSCHAQQFSFADNASFSEGVNNLTKRNSMQLNDIGWTDNNSFFWDMSESNLHEMITLPLKDENEIGVDINEVTIKLSETDYYPELFTKAFESPEVDESKIIEALVHFMSSMTTFNSRFDQQAEKDFIGYTSAERNGKNLFATACGNCHAQGSATKDDLSSLEIISLNPSHFTNGLPILDNEDDIGAGSWAPGYERLFKVPTLRNIDLTGPYMHDGRFVTLEEVIDHYSEGVESNEWQTIIPEGGFGFTDAEKNNLLAFLKTLTDKSFINDIKFSNPFEPHVIFFEEEEKEEVTIIKPFDNMIIKPNPMDDFSIIEFDARPEQKTNLRILDSQGKQIFTEVITGGSYLLNKHDFAAGIYFLKFEQGQETSTQKLMVQ